MRDITDFSAKESGVFNKNKATFDDALREADNSLLQFSESRQLKDTGRLNWTKTHNPKNFLNEEAMSNYRARKFDESTNATAELLEARSRKPSRRISETLKFGSTKEDLQAELEADLGLDLLKVLQAHGITGTAVPLVMDGFTDIVGKEPDVDALIAEWGSGEDGDEADTEEGEDEGMENEAPEEEAPIEEMVKSLRKKVYENRIRNLSKNRY